ncbi:transcriptional regulator [Rathayibacter sp. VKM Ac-2926]|uniref:transcriptional regulator n=1 Tax=Rathayibacter sp. VKM Ac-2926 TaxID=2929477 RepID=UPI001FB43C0A|nr:transcriptional regulator [Rathayibacter sp. VKM Ac-2926]MCJ1703466.1 transcriptional regulator [Rathayibacter sp. VKM Ac-2926]
MTHRSPSGLRILHATRLLGFSGAGEIADRAGAAEDETQKFLREAEGKGWTNEMAFADLRGWSLTDEGRVENERQLARERGTVDPERVIEAVHRSFLPLNVRLLRACTDWQLAPVTEDRFAPNDHSDPERDERILTELAALSAALTPLVDRLTAVLARFGGYDTRFETALRLARSGQHDWVDKASIDSCHRVWFQLHEDLVATLGIDRSTEGAINPS